MAKNPFVFWTFTCDRCMQKETVTGDLVIRSEWRQYIEVPMLPPDWKRFQLKDYCPDCAKKITEVVGE